MERDGQPRLAERLNRLRLAQHARAGGNQHVLSAVRVDRIRHEAVDRRGVLAVEPIGQHRVDQRAFEDAVQRARPR